MKKIRTLLPEDIELRVADKNNKGDVHMLMYITSRSATKLLDETYGAENYNIEYVDVSGQIYCKLSVWDEEHQRYVVRMDTGEEAKISADKSLASDALKRTIVRLGVVELYSGPSIYLPDDNYGNKGYKVSDISYDDNRNIVHLVIVNRFGKEVYRWDEGKGIQTELTTNYTSESENTERKPKYDPQFGTAGMSDEEVFKRWCRKKVDDDGEDKDCVKAFFEYWSKPSKKDPSVMGYSTNGFFDYVEEKYSRHKERFNDYRRG